MTAEIKNGEEKVKFGFQKLGDSTFELDFLPEKNGIYKIFFYLNEKRIKGKKHGQQ